MGLYTGTVRGLSRAPYRERVLVYLLDMPGGDAKLTEAEEAKISRVSRFLDPQDCAQEITNARARA